MALQFKDYSAREREVAITNLNRKLIGKKIVFDTSREVEAYKRLRLEGGQTLKWRLSEAAERTQELRSLQLQARKAGLKSAEELVGAKRVLGITERLGVIRSFTPAEAARFKQIKWRKVDGRLKPVGILPKPTIRVPPRRAPPRAIPKPILEVRAAPIPKKRAERLISKISARAGVLRTERLRGKKPSPKREAELAALTITKTGIAFIMGLVQLPRTLVNVAKDPKQLLGVPAAIKREGEEFGEMLRVSPTEAVAMIGTEIVLLKATTKGIKIVGKLGSQATAKLSPKFVGVKKSAILIPSQVKGKTIKVHLGAPVKKLREPLKVQAKLAGKEVTAVSAQGDKLVNLIKTKRVIRKPIPREAQLSVSTKKLLKEFDRGTIKKNDLIKLNKNIIRETGGEGSLLERSFFADPRGRLRPSRLKLQADDANLLDILSGDITFKTSKPQVLVFEKVRVQQFPKTKVFNQIKSRLKSGKALTKSQADELLKFQLKTSQKFKPIGALTKEPEITLAPNEIIKKEKTIAVTLIKGKKVPIVKAKIVKATKKTKDLLKKADKGIIKTKELKELRRRLKTETGFTPSLSTAPKVKTRVRLPLPKVPRVRVKPKPRKRVKPKLRRPPKPPLRRVPRAPPRKRRIPKRPPRKPPRRPPRKPRVVRKPPRRPPKPPLRRRPRFPPRLPVKVPPRAIPKKLKRVRKKPIVKKVKKGYNVYARPLKKKGVKKIPKLIKINKVPLSKTRAEDLRNYIIDTSLSRTGRVKPVARKPHKPLLKAPSRYSIKTRPKFRKYKIRKKKRVPLKKGKVIERRRRLLDTPQEKKKITLARRLAQLEKKAGIKPKTRRKVTGGRSMTLKTQRRSKPSPAQLSALAKGRRIRKQNLKKRKR